RVAAISAEQERGEIARHDGIGTVRCYLSNYRSFLSNRCQNWQPFPNTPKRKLRESLCLATFVSIDRLAYARSVAFRPPTPPPPHSQNPSAYLPATPPPPLRRRARHGRAQGSDRAARSRSAPPCNRCPARRTPKRPHRPAEARARATTFRRRTSPRPG